MNLRYVFASLVVMLIMMAAMHYTYPYIAEKQILHWSFVFLYTFLFLKYLVGYLVIENKMKSSPKQFVNTFMMFSGIRMLLSVLVIVILVLKTGDHGKFLSVYYVVGYLFFLIVEVYFLFNQSRKAK